MTVFRFAYPEPKSSRQRPIPESAKSSTALLSALLYSVATVSVISNWMKECLDDDAGREQDEDLNEHQDFGQSKDLPPQAGQDEGGEKMAEGREVHEHVPGASYVIYG